MSEAQEYGIKCNVKGPHKYLRMGGLCWIVNMNHGGGSEHVEVLGITHGGRRCRTWTNALDLCRFRSAWMPEHVNRESYHRWTKDEADEWAASLQRNYGDQPVRDHVMQFWGGNDSPNAPAPPPA